MLRLLSVCFFCAVLAGCASVPYSVRLVRPGPGEAADIDNGIPYYLPKPYLLVTRNMYVYEPGKKPETGSDDASAKTVSGSSGYSMSVVYLPDKAMKYALKFKPGLGSHNINVTLQDGWKLTGLNSDSKAGTSELIQAAGQCALNLAELVKTAGLSRGSQPDIASQIEEQLKKMDMKPEIWIFDLTKELPQGILSLDKKIVPGANQAAAQDRDKKSRNNETES